MSALSTSNLIGVVAIIGVLFLHGGNAQKCKNPATLYTSAEGLTGAALKAELHEIVTQENKVVSYNGGGFAVVEV